MKYKTLKHKTLPDTYGVMYGSEENTEIGQTTVPFLQPFTATYEMVKEYWKDFPIVTEQIEDYELVVFPLEKSPLKVHHFKYSEKLLEWANASGAEIVSISDAGRFSEGFYVFYR